MIYLKAFYAATMFWAAMIQLYLAFREKFEEEDNFACVARLLVSLFLFFGCALTVMK